jgi:hypothetical protein
VATPNPNRITDVGSLVQSGLRVHAKSERRVRAVQLADDLSGIYDELTEAQLPVVGETSDVRAFFTDVDRQFQRTRKILEVVEDSLEIGLGHSKLARIAMTAAKLNSGVALVIAGHNLLISASKLDRAHASVTSIREITAERFHDFYRSVGVFIAEAVLFATPINYRIAWKGTRFLNNKFLYALRYSRFSGKVDSLLKGLHRLLLSEIHYAIRGILPTALRTPDEFVAYLAALSTQTLKIVHQFSDLSFSDISSKARAVVNEYHEFAETTYDVATAEVNIDSVVTTVIGQLTGSADPLSLTTAQYDL